jgi:hypothetical protein
MLMRNALQRFLPVGKFFLAALPALLLLLYKNNVAFF